MILSTRSPRVPIPCIDGFDMPRDLNRGGIDRSRGPPSIALRTTRGGSVTAGVLSLVRMLDGSAGWASTVLVRVVAIGIAILAGGLVTLLGGDVLLSSAELEEFSSSGSLFMSRVARG
jgi:hypothetical protein